MAVESMTVSNDKKMGIFFCNFGFDEESILVGFVGVGCNDTLPCSVGVSKLHFELFFLSRFLILFWFWD